MRLLEINLPPNREIEFIKAATRKDFGELNMSHRLTHLWAANILASHGHITDINGYDLCILKAVHDHLVAKLTELDSQYAHKTPFTLPAGHNCQPENAARAPIVLGEANPIGLPNPADLLRQVKSGILSDGRLDKIRQTLEQLKAILESGQRFVGNYSQAVVLELLDAINQQRSLSVLGIGREAKIANSKIITPQEMEAQFLSAPSLQLSRWHSALHQIFTNLFQNYAINGTQPTVNGWSMQLIKAFHDKLVIRLSQLDPMFKHQTDIELPLALQQIDQSIIPADQAALPVITPVVAVQTALEAQTNPLSLVLDRLRQAPDEVPLVKGYLQLVGSTVQGRNPNDTDLLIRDFKDNEAYRIAITHHIFAKHDGNKLHIIYSPQGPHGPAIPIYDLVLRKKPVFNLVESIRSLWKRPKELEPYQHETLASIMSELREATPKLFELMEVKPDGQALEKHLQSAEAQIREGLIQNDPELIFGQVQQTLNKLVMIPSKYIVGPRHLQNLLDFSHSFLAREVEQHYPQYVTANRQAPIWARATAKIQELRSSPQVNHETAEQLLKATIREALQKDREPILFDGELHSQWLQIMGDRVKESDKASFTAATAIEEMRGQTFETGQQLALQLKKILQEGAADIAFEKGLTPSAPISPQPAPPPVPPVLNRRSSIDNEDIQNPDCTKFDKELANTITILTELQPVVTGQAAIASQAVAGAQQQAAGLCKTLQDYLRVIGQRYQAPTTEGECVRRDTGRQGNLHKAFQAYCLPLGFKESLQLPIQPLKSVGGFDTQEFTNIDQLWKNWGSIHMAKGPVIVQPKINGLRTIAAYQNGRANIYFEDSKVNRVPGTPKLATELAAIAKEAGGDIVLDGEMIAIDKSGQALPRVSLGAFRSSKPPEDEAVMEVFDILDANGQSLVDQPLSERLHQLRSLFEKTKPIRKHFQLLPSWTAKTQAQLATWAKTASEYRASEGAFFKTARSTYSLGGDHRTNEYSKLKHAEDLDVVVLSVQVKQNGYTYEGGVLLQAGDDPAKYADVKQQQYVSLGDTFVTTLKAQVGSIIEVKIHELNQQMINGKLKLAWQDPNVKDFAQTPDSVSHALAIGTLLHGRSVVKEASTYINSMRAGKRFIFEPQSGAMMDEVSKWAEDHYPLLVQPKLDGFRAQLQIKGGKPGLYLGTGLEAQQNVIGSWPELARTIESAKLEDMTLDGELQLIAADGPLSKLATARLVGAGRHETNHKAIISLFDILEAAQDMRDQPLGERSTNLNARSFGSTPLVKLPSYIANNSNELSEAIARAKQFVGSEGAMLKDANSHYHGGQSQDWAKIREAQTLVATVEKASAVAGKPRSRVYSIAIESPDGRVSLSKTLPSSIQVQPGQRALVRFHEISRTGNGYQLTSPVVLRVTSDPTIEAAQLEELALRESDLIHEDSNCFQPSVKFLADLQQRGFDEITIRMRFFFGQADFLLETKRSAPAFAIRYNTLIKPNLQQLEQRLQIAVGSWVEQARANPPSPCVTTQDQMVIEFMNWFKPIMAQAEIDAKAIISSLGDPPDPGYFTEGNAIRAVVYTFIDSTVALIIRGIFKLAVSRLKIIGAVLFGNVTTSAIEVKAAEIATPQLQDLANELRIKANDAWAIEQQQLVLSGRAPLSQDEIQAIADKIIAPLQAEFERRTNEIMDQALCQINGVSCGSLPPTTPACEQAKQLWADVFPLNELPCIILAQEDQALSALKSQDISPCQDLISQIGQGLIQRNAECSQIDSACNSAKAQLQMLTSSVDLPCNALDANYAIFSQLRQLPTQTCTDILTQIKAALDARATACGQPHESLRESDTACQHLLNWIDSMQHIDCDQLKAKHDEYDSIIQQIIAQGGNCPDSVNFGSQLNGLRAQQCAAPIGDCPALTLLQDPVYEQSFGAQYDRWEKSANDRIDAIQRKGMQNDPLGNIAQDLWMQAFEGKQNKGGAWLTFVSSVRDNCPPDSQTLNNRLADYTQQLLTDLETRFVAALPGLEHSGAVNLDTIGAIYNAAIALLFVIPAIATNIVLITAWARTGLTKALQGLGSVAGKLEGLFKTASSSTTALAQELVRINEKIAQLEALQFRSATDEAVLAQLNKDAMRIGARFTDAKAVMDNLAKAQEWAQAASRRMPVMVIGSVELAQIIGFDPAQAMVDCASPQVSDMLDSFKVKTQDLVTQLYQQAINSGQPLDGQAIANSVKTQFQPEIEAAQEVIYEACAGAAGERAALNLENHAQELIDAIPNQPNMPTPGSPSESFREATGTPFGPCPDTAKRNCSTNCQAAYRSYVGSELTANQLSDLIYYANHLPTRPVGEVARIASAETAKIQNNMAVLVGGQTAETACAIVQRAIADALGNIKRQLDELDAQNQSSGTTNSLTLTADFMAVRIAAISIAWRRHFFVNAVRYNGLVESGLDHVRLRLDLLIGTSYSDSNAYFALEDQIIREEQTNTENQITASQGHDDPICSGQSIPDQSILTKIQEDLAANQKITCEVLAQDLQKLTSQAVCVPFDLQLDWQQTIKDFQKQINLTCSDPNRGILSFDLLDQIIGFVRTDAVQFFKPIADQAQQLGFTDLQKQIESAADMILTNMVIPKVGQLVLDINAFKIQLESTIKQQAQDFKAQLAALIEAAKQAQGKATCGAIQTLTDRLKPQNCADLDPVRNAFQAFNAADYSTCSQAAKTLQDAITALAQKCGG